MKALVIDNISKKFDNKEVLKDVNISLDKGEIISLLGESGTGKTTLFNIIGGFLLPDKGQVLLNEKNIVGELGHIGYMQQKDLLISYKNILENAALPLILNKVKKDVALNEARKHLEDFGLLGYEELMPHELSGGMKQRVSLLRTYLWGKDVVLLDEPFSALDYMTKHKLQNWYLKTADKMNFSTFIITHDIEEAVYLSDRIYILNANNKDTMIIDIDRNCPKDEYRKTQGFNNKVNEIYDVLK